MPIPADDEMAATSSTNIKGIIEAAMKGGDAQAVIAALEDKGYSIRASAGEDAPIEGQGEDEASDMRPERNPADESGGQDIAAQGEPMSIDQIGSDLFEQYMKPGAAGAAPAT
jgi:hypothetical protein